MLGKCSSVSLEAERGALASWSEPRHVCKQARQGALLLVVVGGVRVLRQVLQVEVQDPVPTQGLAKEARAKKGMGTVASSLVFQPPPPTECPRVIWVKPKPPAPAREAIPCFYIKRG